MFRLLMAVNLLKRGVSLENVAAIFGNSVRIVEKHYARWFIGPAVRVRGGCKKDVYDVG